MVDFHFGLLKILCIGNFGLSSQQAVSLKSIQKIPVFESSFGKENYFYWQEFYNDKWVENSEFFEKSKSLIEFLKNGSEDKEKCSLYLKGISNYLLLSYETVLKEYFYNPLLLRDRVEFQREILKRKLIFQNKFISSYKLLYGYKGGNISENNFLLYDSQGDNEGFHKNIEYLSVLNPGDTPIVAVLDLDERNLPQAEIEHLEEKFHLIFLKKEKDSTNLVKAINETSFPWDLGYIDESNIRGRWAEMYFRRLVHIECRELVGKNDEQSVLKLSMDRVLKKYCSSIDVEDKTIPQRYPLKDYSIKDGEIKFQWKWNE